MDAVLFEWEGMYARVYAEVYVGGVCGEVVME